MVANMIEEMSASLNNQRPKERSVAPRPARTGAQVGSDRKTLSSLHGVGRRCHRPVAAPSEDTKAQMPTSV